MLAILIIFFAWFFTYIPWLGSFGPLDPTDSFFLESGRELVEVGNYLLPLNNYEPWLDKPILYFWLVAIAYKIGGVSSFIGRLPSALSALALAFTIFISTCSITKKHIALLASIIFLTCPISSVIGHLSLTDMTLSFCISGCILFLYLGIKTRSNKNIILGYLALALGFLCKGPIVLIICGLTFTAYILSKKPSLQNFIEEILSFKPILGLLIITIINLPWYISANIFTHGQFFQDFFIVQNFGRVQGTVNHQEPFWFYLPIVLGGLFPWSILSLVTIKRTNPKIDLFRLCMCWFLTTIILFSLIKTKLPTYILPAMPAFVIMLALQLESFMFKKHGKTALISLCLISLLGCGIIVPYELKSCYAHRQTGFNKLVSLAKKANANIAILSAEEPSIQWLTHKHISRILNPNDANLYIQSKNAPHYILVPKEVLQGVITESCG